MSVVLETLIWLMEIKNFLLLLCMLLHFMIHSWISGEVGLFLATQFLLKNRSLVHLLYIQENKLKEESSNNFP